MVSINYRLGALGWMVSVTDNLWGNYGLQVKRGGRREGVCVLVRTHAIVVDLRHLSPTTLGWSGICRAPAGQELRSTKDDNLLLL